MKRVPRTTKRVSERTPSELRADVGRDQGTFRELRAAVDGGLPRLRLLSRSSAMLESFERCSNCEQDRCPVTYFARSNRGAVFICNGCLNAVMERSFRRRDAMDGAVQGGSPGLNRRR
jgi:hypothetical protein